MLTAYAKGSKMNDLRTILEKIKVQKSILNVEIGEESSTSRNLADRKRNAKVRIDELKAAYRNALLERTVFIVMYGNDAVKMASMAEKEFGSYAADAEQVINRIVEEVPTQSYKGKNASPSLFDVISHAIEGVAAEAGVISFPNPIYSSSRHSGRLEDKEALKRLVTKVISEDIGTELIAVHAVTATFLKALDTEFDGKVYPVVLHTSSIAYATALVKDIDTRLKRQVFTITTATKDLGTDEKGNELSEETVGIQKDTIVINSVDKKNLTAALTKIKKSLGGK